MKSKWYETKQIEEIANYDSENGNPCEDFLVEDKKRNITLLVVAIALDCGGTIDWSCIIGYDVYVFTGDEDDRAYEKYLGRMQHISQRSLRRFMTKTLPLVIYNNPYGDETDMLRKRVNPNSKNFSGDLNGNYTFTWSACCGATFCLHHYENDTYELKTSENPDDCWDWSGIENFKVE